MAFYNIFFVKVLILLLCHLDQPIIEGVSLINMENSIKGLLIKDWKLISSQRQFGVMVILFYFLTVSAFQLPP